MAVFVLETRRTLGIWNMLVAGGLQWLLGPLRRTWTKTVTCDPVCVDLLCIAYCNIVAVRNCVNIYQYCRSLSQWPAQNLIVTLCAR